MPPIIDTFLFSDELDLLELRLAELAGLVDRFIAVESPYTFSRRPKPLLLHEHRSRFAAWPLEIRTCPTQGEAAARAACFADLPTDALLLHGDIDEIPRRDGLADLASKPLPAPVKLEQPTYMYSINRLLLTFDGRQPVGWAGTVAFHASHAPNGDLAALRDARDGFVTRLRGGWHLSWLGTPEQVLAKFLSLDPATDFATYGGDLTVPTEAEVLARATARDLCPFGRPLLRVPIEPGRRQPQNVLAWLAAHPQYE